MVNSDFNLPFETHYGEDYCALYDSKANSLLGEIKADEKTLEFIRRACNSHSELLEAANVLLGRYKRDQLDKGNADDKRVFANLEAAIAKAEGK